MAVDGRKIRQLRKKLGFTQEELGKRLGVIKQTVSNWENNISEPNSETLSKMTLIFDVPIGYLYENVFFDTTSTKEPSEFALRSKDRILKLLQERQMSEEDLAGSSGVDSEELRPFLHGRRAPSVDDLAKISRALGVSSDYLLGLSGQKCASPEEEKLLQYFRRCDDECKNYLTAKAGVLCVEGISAAMPESKK